MAIQVNGTTVIDNSRALTNISSLDSTTTATIGAAAGGGMELLSETTLGSATSSFDISFTSGYRGFIIQAENIEVNRNDYSSEAIVRLTNTSGTAYTGGSDYTYVKIEGEPSSSQAGELWFGRPKMVLSGNNNPGHWYITVWNPRNSGWKTYVTMQDMTWGTFQTGYGAAGWSGAYQGYKSTASDDGRIRFAAENYSFNSGLKYQVWGIK